MENPTNSISDNGDTKSLINECFAFCSTLTARECKFSFTLRLGSSFTFSLASEQVAPTAKSRSPSYLRRQQRRRAAFLEKRAQNSPDKKTSASKQCSRQKEDNNRQINDDVDINCPLNLDPNPALGGFLFLKISECPIGHAPKLLPLLHCFRTVFVFALRPFLPMWVLFLDYNGDINGKMAMFGHLAIEPYATNRGKWGIPEKNYKNVAQQC